jgi:Tol biopolymer transport system component
VTLWIPINGKSFAISPDGGRIAFIGVRGGKTSLFVHALTTGKTVEVPDTRDASHPAFSPDSQWLAYVDMRRALRKLPAAGGPIQLVCECPTGQIAWVADNRILRGGGIRPIQEVGAEERPVTELAPGDESHATPLLLPDGSLLFTAIRGGWLSTRNSIAVWPPNGSVARELVPNATTPQLLGSDAVVFARGRTLFAAGFDSRSIQLIGEPRALDLQVQTTSYSAAPMYTLAGNGTLVYARPAGGRRLVWTDRHGNEEYLKADEQHYSHLRISPDGTRVAINRSDGDRDIWVYTRDGSLEQRLTSGPERDAMPVWSPDGAQIFFTSGERTIYRIPADGAKGPTAVYQLTPPGRVHATSITPDGKRLLTQWDLLPKSVDMRVLELAPTPTLTRLPGQSGTERDARLSPNGRWIVYQTAESTEGEGQAVVRPFPDIQSRRWIVSPNVGRQPIWSHDGREIFYRTEDGTVMSVPVKTSPVFEHGSPVRVMTPVDTLRDWANGPTYDVSPDGRRFLFIKTSELDIRSLNVVLNWDVEVKAALGQGK